MPVIPGTHGIKEAVGEFSFATDGGAIGTITLRSPQPVLNGNEIPAGSVIEGGYIEIDTLFTSGGAATVAVSAETAGDLQPAIVVSGAPWSTTGRKSVTPAFTGAASVKTTVTRNITFTIAVAALTAGAGRVVVFYR